MKLICDVDFDMSFSFIFLFCLGIFVVDYFCDLLEEVKKECLYEL